MGRAAGTAIRKVIPKRLAAVGIIRGTAGAAGREIRKDIRKHPAADGKKAIAVSPVLAAATRTMRTITARGGVTPETTTMITVAVMAAAVGSATRAATRKRHVAVDKPSLAT